MILGYILLGFIAGILGAATALVSGASAWSAFGIYVLAGCAGTLAVPLYHVIAHLLTGRPLLPDHEEYPEFGPQTATAAPNGVFTVLAVDDDPFTLELVKTIGTNAGNLDVVTASSGAEALALLANGKRTFDYLLCDISMPHMSGIALCQAVRRMDRYRNVPLVMLTARRDKNHIAASLRAGATDYITKPFDIEDLRQRLETALAAFTAQRDEATSVESRPQAQPHAMLDTATLSTYLTLLSAPDAAATQVLAVRINPLETLRTRHAPDRLATLLDKVAATVASSLTAGHSVMAWTTEGDLLVATSAADMVNATRLEQLISADLQAWDPVAASQDPSSPCVCVGEPVPLQGTRSRRAELAIGRAVGSAADISLLRDGAALAHLRQTFNA